MLDEDAPARVTVAAFSQAPPIVIVVPPEVNGLDAGVVTVGADGAEVSRTHVRDTPPETMPLMGFSCVTVKA